MRHSASPCLMCNAVQFLFAPLIPYAVLYITYVAKPHSLCHAFHPQLHPIIAYAMLYNRNATKPHSVHHAVPYSATHYSV